VISISPLKVPKKSNKNQPPTPPRWGSTPDPEFVAWPFLYAINHKIHAQKPWRSRKVSCYPIRRIKSWLRHSLDFTPNCEITKKVLFLPNDASQWNRLRRGHLPHRNHVKQARTKIRLYLKKLAKSQKCHKKWKTHQKVLISEKNTPQWNRLRMGHLPQRNHRKQATAYFWLYLKNLYKNLAKPKSVTESEITRKVLIWAENTPYWNCLGRGHLPHRNHKNRLSIIFTLLEKFVQKFG